MKIQTAVVLACVVLLSLHKMEMVDATFISVTLVRIFPPRRVPFHEYCDNSGMIECVFAYSPQEQSSASSGRSSSSPVHAPRPGPQLLDNWTKCSELY